MLVEQMLLVLRTLLVVEETSLRVFLLEAMLHLSTVFQKLMVH